MPAKPAFFSWLGVVPYLTLDAFRATLAFVGSLPAGSGLAFDYAFPPDTLTPERRAVFDLLAAPGGRRRRTVPASSSPPTKSTRSCATPASIASSTPITKSSTNSTSRTAPTGSSSRPQAPACWPRRGGVNE